MCAQRAEGGDTEAMACETVSLRIPALTPAQIACAGCLERVCAAVRVVPGVLTVECDAATVALSVCWDPELVTLEEIEGALSAASASAAGGIEHAAYRLTGLD